MQQSKIQVWNENFSRYHQQELGIVNDAFSSKNSVSVYTGMLPPIDKSRMSRGFPIAYVP